MSAVEALPLTPDSGEMSAAVVTAHNDDGACELQVQGRSCTARVAVSCLVQPEPDDRVLIAEFSSATWVLAVLERPGEGALNLHSERDLELGSAGALHLRSADLGISATRANMNTEKLSLRSGELDAQLGTLRVVGRWLSSAFDRLTSSARLSLRKVEQLDQLRAGQIDQRSEKGMRLHGDNVLVTAKGLARIDADQIHMG